MTEQPDNQAYLDNLLQDFQSGGDTFMDDPPELTDEFEDDLGEADLSDAFDIVNGKAQTDTDNSDDADTDDATTEDDADDSAEASGDVSDDADDTKDDDAADTSTPAPPPWDPERQRRDQEHAAERKKLQQEIETLRAERDALATRGDSAREDDDGYDAADLDELDPETAEIDDIIKAVKALRADNRRLETELSIAKTDQEQRTRQQVEQQQVQETTAFQQQVIKDHGVEVWNAAVEKARQMARDDGADQDIDHTTAMRYLRLAAREAASDAKDRQPDPSEKKTPRRRGTRPQDTKTAAAGTLDFSALGPAHAVDVDAVEAHLRRTGQLDKILRGK